jgi:single-strand DNA-binding protein
MPDGRAVANISLATSSRRKDKQTGDVVEDVQWHRVTFYERLAEIVSEYVKKGSPIYIEGRLKYGEYTDKEGVKRYSTDIIATEMQLLGSREGGQTGAQGGGNAPRGQQRDDQQQARGNGGGYDNTRGGYDQGGGNTGGRPPQRAAGGGQPQPQQQRQAPAPQGRAPSGFEDMDSDIPFKDPLSFRGAHLVL